MGVWHQSFKSIVQICNWLRNHCALWCLSKSPKSTNRYLQHRQALSTIYYEQLFAIIPVPRGNSSSNPHLGGSMFVSKNETGLLTGLLIIHYEPFLTMSQQCSSPSSSPSSHHHVDRWLACPGTWVCRIPSEVADAPKVRRAVSQGAALDWVLQPERPLVVDYVATTMNYHD